MSKKKVAAIMGTVVAIAAIGGGIWMWKGGNFKGGSDKKIFVESIASITNTNPGFVNRYMGVVEPQKSVEIRKDEEKKIKEIFVAEGDEVSQGTPLFEYDNSGMENEIAQAELELERMDHEIESNYNQIKTLKTERDAAPSDMKFQYTTEIQTIETSIKQTEYNKESKKAEIEKKKKEMENSVVKSEIAGVIKSLNENQYDTSTGQEVPFLTILATGDFRIKGKVSEQNIWSFYVDMPVLIRSRIDETQTWTGTISEIVTNGESGENENQYFDSGMSETSTKYPFYVVLDDAEGLMLGQHLYIETDFDQIEVKEGLWLYEGYVMVEEDGNFVWVANKNEKMEKRAIEVGEYDTDLGMYQILSGVTEEDCIAFPMDYIEEGLSATKNLEEAYQGEMNSEDGTMPEDEMYMEDGVVPEGYPEDGTMPEDEIYTEDGTMPEDEIYTEDGIMPEGEMIPEENTVSEDEMVEEVLPEEGVQEEATETESEVEE